MAIPISFSMATPYRPIQQPLLLPGQAAYPPQVAHGYTPKNQGASAPYPPPTVQGYPPQGYPPQTHDLPPPYSTLEQRLPPANQPGHSYQPQLANTSFVVAAQPVTATPTTRVSPPEENHYGVAVCALVFSILTLMTCGASVICLSFSIPALILSIIALNTRGRSQKSNAGISIGLNVAVVVCTVVVLVAVVTPAAVSAAGTRYCSPYYSSTYRTYCVPYSYSTQGSCSYFDFSSSFSRNSYCPSTSTYRCPSFYSSTYNTFCSAFGYSSCSYFPSRSCPSSAFRECPSFYSSTYSTRCVSNTYFTISSTPCSYYVSFTNASSYCPI